MIYTCLSGMNKVITKNNIQEFRHKAYLMEIKIFFIV